MARHSSITRQDRAEQHKRNRITRDLTTHIGDEKANRFKHYDRLLSEASGKFGLIAELNKQVDAGGPEAVTARRRLREMKDVRYFVDKETSPGELFQPEGKRLARGSSGKADRILRGHNARKSQGKGI